MEKNYTILLKRTLDQLKESQIIIGKNFSLICLSVLFIIGTLGNILLFIQIKNYLLISNKLHLINLIINNLLILNIVLPANFLQIIQTKNSHFDQLNEQNEDNSLNSATENPFSLYKQLIRAENCESQSALTLIAFFVNLFNFLLFFMHHKKTVQKTEFFYSNWFKLKKDFVLENFKKAKLNELSKGQNYLVDELTNSSLSDDLSNSLLNDSNKNLLNNLKNNCSLNVNISNESQTLKYLTTIYQKDKIHPAKSNSFTGQTFADIIFINIKNFIFCFLTTWTVTLL